MNRKVILIFLSAMMFFATCIPSYAAAMPKKIPEKENFYIAQMSNTRVMVIENGKMFFVDIERTGNIIKTDIESISDGQHESLIVNLEEETLYSTITQQTISSEEIFGREPPTETTRNVFQLKETSFPEVQVLSNTTSPSTVYVGYVIKKIFYQTLSKIVTSASSAATIAGAILTILAWAGLTVLNPVAGVVSLIGGVLLIIQYNLSKKSPYHGLQLTLYKYKVTRFRQGRWHTYYNYKINRVVTYYGVDNEQQNVSLHHGNYIASNIYALCSCIFLSDTGECTRGNRLDFCCTGSGGITNYHVVHIESVQRTR